jgi:hypothetical protein
VKLSARQERGKRGQEAFKERFEQKNDHPPAVIARLEMLDRDVDDLDKPFVGAGRLFSPSKLSKLGGEPTVFVQLLLGPGHFLDAKDVLVNLTLYQFYEAVHALCFRRYIEAIGEPPQDPRDFLAVDNYVGDSSKGDVRAVLTLC